MYGYNYSIVLRLILLVDGILMEQPLTVKLQWVVKVKVNVITGLWRSILQMQLLWHGYSDDDDTNEFSSNSKIMGSQ